MEIEFRLILLMAILFSSTVVAFSALSEERLDVYISMFILEYFILVALHSPFKRKANLYMNIIGGILLTIFSLIVAFRVIEILYGVNLWNILGF